MISLLDIKVPAQIKFTLFTESLMDGVKRWFRACRTFLQVVGVSRVLKLQVWTRCSYQIHGF